MGQMVLGGKEARKKMVTWPENNAVISQVLLIAFIFIHDFKYNIKVFKFVYD